MKIGIIGGGAAGFFAAITTAETSKASITILEKSPNVLSKVRISGGGRKSLLNTILAAAKNLFQPSRGLVILIQ